MDAEAGRVAVNGTKSKPGAPTFAAKLSAALDAIGMVGKDGKNTFHGYAYTSAAAVQRAVQRALSEHGLYISSRSEIVESAQYVTKSNVHGVRITMKTTVTVSDGVDSATGEGYGCGQDTEDKGPMKAQTASYKYALCALFCIGMGDDPEADDDKSTVNAAQVALQAAQAKERDEDAAFASELVKDLAEIGAAEDLETWTRMHWYQVRGMSTNAKGRIWTAMRKAAKGLGVKEADLKQWCSESTGPEEDK